MLNIYTCGPTIYNRSHIGHARTFLFNDILLRYLKFNNIPYTSCINVTDIDDKIVDKCYRKKFVAIIENLIEKYGLEKVLQNIINNEIHPKTYKKTLELTSIDELGDWILKQKLEIITEDELKVTHKEYKQFIDEKFNFFWEDLSQLNIEKPNVIIRVSDSLYHIIEYIKKIEENGFCYESNGSVYFDTKKLEKAGFDVELLKNITDDTETKNSHISDKKNKEDFALWKAEKRFDISFNSPWGKGRPGWHIECSAMIKYIFGDTLDIHGGGEDLIFPHHNNECVQMFGHFLKKDVVPKKFFHISRLNKNEEKMSQSKKNFITIKKSLNSVSSRQLRLMLLKSKSNKIQSFTEDQYEQTKILDNRFYKTYINLINIKKTNDTNETELFKTNCEKLNKLIETFVDLDHKLFLDKNKTKYISNISIDTCSIITDLEELCHEIAKLNDLENLFSKKNLKSIMSIFDKCFSYLGLKYKSEIASLKEDKTNELIETIVEIRDYIRNIAKHKEINKSDLFKLSDWIRDEKLKKYNVKLEDYNKKTSIY